MCGVLHIQGDNDEQPVDTINPAADDQPWTIVARVLSYERVRWRPGLRGKCPPSFWANCRIITKLLHQDCSSRPLGCPHRTSEVQRAAILALRRARCTYREISRRTGVAHSTVGLVAGIRGQGSTGTGWEYVHVAIDDHSRVSFACIQPGETAHSACSALLDALRYFRTLGVSFTRVMTDNGSCYRSKRFAKLCRRLKLRHTRTRPYTPRTNRKAERFIQSALREWAYARAYDNSSQRGEHLPCWLHRYNWHRPHASLKYRTPIQALNIPMNNVVGLHS